MTEREQSALRGPLYVLLGVREELEAVGASFDRRARNRAAIADARSRLEGERLGDGSGDLTDATSASGS